MSLMKIFSRAKWKSKDAKIRARAVATSQEAALIEKLNHFAQQDNDAAVRIAAINRLGDANFLLNLLSNEQDSSVQSAIKSRLYNLLKSTPEELNDFHEKILSLLSIEQTKQLARHENKNLRFNAVHHIQGQGSLGDLLLQEQDEIIRSTILSRIEQESTLKRIAQQARKQDKNLYHQINTRLQQQLIDQGDKKAINAHAENLLQRLNKLSEHKGDAKQALEQIEKEWQQLPNWAKSNNNSAYQNSKSLVLEIMAASDPAYLENLEAQRVESLKDLAKEIKETYQKLEDVDFESAQKLLSQLKLKKSQLKVPQTEIAKSLIDNIDSAIEKCQQIIEQKLSELPAHDEISEQLAKVEELELTPLFKISTQQLTRIESRTIQLCSQLELTQKDQHAKSIIMDKISALSQKLAEHKQKSLELEKEYPDQLSKFEQAIEEKQLHSAAKYRKKLLHIRKNLRGNKRIFGTNTNSLFNRLDAQFNEMLEWLHWSNNDKRMQLISDLKALPITQMHPDAVAEKVKQSQKLWKELDQSEFQLAGRRRFTDSEKLWKEFHQISNQLFKPAKQFFKKRSEVQTTHFDQVNQHLTKLDSLLKEGEQNWKEIYTLISILRKDLRSMDQLPPAKRGNIAGKIRQKLSNADHLIKKKDDEVAQKKQTIIDQAEQIAARDDLEQAAQELKELQRKWQQAGTMQRSREQKLWKKFRIHCDVVFDKIKNERKAAIETENLEYQQAQQYLDDFKNNLKSDLDPEELPSKLNKFISGWSELAKKSTKAEQQFNSICSDAQAMYKDYQQSLKHQSLNNYFIKLKHCMAKESDRPSEIDDTQWQQLKTNDVCDPLFEQRLNGTLKTDAQGDEKWLNTLLALEHQNGIESPAEYAQQRMSLQVDLLAKKLEGDYINDIETATWEYLCQLLQAYPISSSELINLDRINNIARTLTNK
ncbi:MAG: DUF349 domain-containing protein [bacterium]